MAQLRNGTGHPPGREAPEPKLSCIQEDNLRGERNVHEWDAPVTMERPTIAASRTPKIALGVEVLKAPIIVSDADCSSPDMTHWDTWAKHMTESLGELKCEVKNLRRRVHGLDLVINIQNSHITPQVFLEEEPEVLISLSESLTTPYSRMPPSFGIRLSDLRQASEDIWAEQCTPDSHVDETDNARLEDGTEVTKPTIRISDMRPKQSSDDIWVDECLPDSRIDKTNHDHTWLQVPDMRPNEVSKGILAYACPPATQVDEVGHVHVLLDDIDAVPITQLASGLQDAVLAKSSPEPRRLVSDLAREPSFSREGSLLRDPLMDITQINTDTLSAGKDSDGFTLSREGSIAKDPILDITSLSMSPSWPMCEAERSSAFATWPVLVPAAKVKRTKSCRFPELDADLPDEFEKMSPFSSRSPVSLRASLELEGCDHMSQPVSRGVTEDSLASMTSPGHGSLCCSPLPSEGSVELMSETAAPSFTDAPMPHMTQDMIADGLAAVRNVRQELRTMYPCSAPGSSTVCGAQQFLTFSSQRSSRLRGNARWKRLSQSPPRSSPQGITPAAAPPVHVHQSISV